MFEWLTQAALDFVHQYGYAALFVFIILETAWIIHFVPSEIIIPATAVFLVDDPASFAFFVGVMTVGAILGSLVAYYLFGVSGEEFLREYGHIVKLPESEIERSQAWFQRWGEGLMFWGRVVPVVRTPISIPAGFARMHLGKFTLYSAGGWLVYNAALVWLVYGNADEKAPIDMVVAWLADATAAYGTGVVAGVGVVALAAFGVGWWKLTRGEVSNPVS
ncbi:DedA family protein [Halorussus halophilus]|uniref:DedA family protein n=1 Tax=Halorussus halophilus TaxID=2650975 RepID=UPI0013018BF7|nr:DedA family protein [Halorussus halophilus]